MLKAPTPLLLFMIWCKAKVLVVYEINYAVRENDWLFEAAEEIRFLFSS
jgi:hypothetical protein